MRWFTVLVRPTAPAIGPSRLVPVWAMGENQAVQAVSRKVHGTVHAVAFAPDYKPV